MWFETLPLVKQVWKILATSEGRFAPKFNLEIEDFPSWTAC